eukprot:scaffold1118_cov249-Pinguiococcus_pyrenoidosus.AAC.3
MNTAFCDAYVTWGLLRKAKPSLAPFVISADDQEQTKAVVNNCLNILNFGWDNGAGLLEVVYALMPGESLSDCLVDEAEGAVLLGAMPYCFWQ